MDDSVPPNVSVSFYSGRTVYAASLPMEMIYIVKSASPGPRSMKASLFSLTAEYRYFISAYPWK